MKLPLQIVLVLCAIATGIGTVLRPGVPEIAIVLGVALGSVYWLQKMHRNLRVRVSDPKILNG